MSPLLGGGCNEHGSVLRSSTLATMFEPLPATSAVPGMGLGFFRHDANGHRVVGHEEILPGFNSGILLAPDDGVGVFALTNGSRRAMVWLPTELAGLLHRFSTSQPEARWECLPAHTELWDLLCGRTRLPPVGDPRPGHDGGRSPGVRPRWPAHAPRPSPWRPTSGENPPDPDSETDPYVFRLDLSELAMPPVRLVFDRDPDPAPPLQSTDLGGQPISLYRDPRGGAVASGPEVPWGQRRWLLALGWLCGGPGAGGRCRGDHWEHSVDGHRPLADERPGIGKVVRSGEASSREVIEAHARIEEVNPSINAVTVVFAEQALEAAKTADDAVAAGMICPHSTGALHRQGEHRPHRRADPGLKAWRRRIRAGMRRWSKSPCRGAIPIGHTNCSTITVRWHTDSEH